MNYMCESAFSVKGDFKDSWDFIEQDMHSIERYTNLPICLESEMQEKKVDISRNLETKGVKFHDYYNWFESKR